MPDQDVTRGHGPAEHAAEELFRARAARFLRRRLDPEAATGLALTVALALIFAAAASAFEALPPEAKAQAGDFGKTLAARAKAAQAAGSLTASAFGALPASGPSQ